jgi:hypothetical protein
MALIVPSLAVLRMVKWEQPGMGGGYYLCAIFMQWLKSGVGE